MNRRSVFIGLAIWVVALGAAASIWTMPGGTNARRVTSSVPVATSSIYDLASLWTTDEQRTVPLSSLRGNCVVVAMIFTRCQSVCPTLVRQLVSLQRTLPERLRSRTRFALITIDPDYDTVERLRAYRGRMGLRQESWALLRGSPLDVREVAAALGFGFNAATDGQITHSKLVTLLDARGRILLQRADITADPGQIARAVDAAIQAEVPE